MPSQKPSTASASPSACAASSAGRHTSVDIGVRTAPVIGRDAWAPRKRGLDRHTPAARRSPRGRAQHLQFGLDIKAVARLDLDRRDALRRSAHRARGRAAAISSSSLAARVAVTDETMPPPARAISVVARAMQPHLEFGGAVAAMDEMGMAVDQAGRHQPPFAVDPVSGREVCGQRRHRAAPRRSRSPVHRQRPARDQAKRPARRQRSHSRSIWHGRLFPA